MTKRRSKLRRRMPGLGSDSELLAFFAGNRPSVPIVVYLSPYWEELPRLWREYCDMHGGTGTVPLPKIDAEEDREFVYRRMTNADGEGEKWAAPTYLPKGGCSR